MPHRCLKNTEWLEYFCQAIILPQGHLGADLPVSKALHAFSLFTQDFWPCSFPSVTATWNEGNRDDLIYFLAGPGLSYPLRTWHLLLLGPHTTLPWSQQPKIAMGLPVLIRGLNGSGMPGRGCKGRFRCQPGLKGTRKGSQERYFGTVTAARRKVQ